MSSILIQYATASPISVGSVGTLSKVRRSIPKGGSASAMAAASGDADPRRNFFEGGGALVAGRARLTIVVKKRDVMHVIARGRRYTFCRASTRRPSPFSSSPEVFSFALQSFDARSYGPRCLQPVSHIPFLPSECRLVTVFGFGYVRGLPYPQHIPTFRH
jgi:hypothetical protein